MNRRLFINALVCLMTSLGLYAFSSEDIVSPRQGVWANRQLLIALPSSDEEVYYCLGSGDPLLSGLAYDGPVLLEAEGEVTLTLAVVNSKKERKNFTVSYNVSPVDIRGESIDAEVRDFLTFIENNTLVHYSPGSIFNIPPDLDYSFGDGGIWLNGNSLKLNSQTNTMRYAPCQVKSKGALWGFVIYVVPTISGTMAKEPLPFAIHDWTTLDFSDGAFIYRIDDGPWESIKGLRQIDRSVFHTIYWQSVEYKRGNLVSQFKLAPKPAVSRGEDDDGAVAFELSGADGYQFIDSAKERDPFIAPGSFNAIYIDSFYGEKIEAQKSVYVYYKGVYQGDMPIRYSVDKRPPSPPVFFTDTKGDFSRDDVVVKVLPSGKQDKLYYLIQKDDELSLPLPKSDEFMPLITQDLILTRSEKDVTAYRVLSYSKALNGLTSTIASYSVKIDNVNYYVDSTIRPLEDKALGTREFPYSTLEEALFAARNASFSRIYIHGDVECPPSLVVENDCMLIASKGTKLTVPQGSNILVKGSSLNIMDLEIQKSAPRSGVDNSLSLFNLEASVLSLSSVKINQEGQNTSLLINSKASIVNIKDCVLSSSGKSYASVLSGTSSKVDIKASHLIASAQTSVCLSVNKGSIDLEGSTLLASGNMGRIMELTGVKAKLISNQFNAKLNTVVQIDAIYKDVTTVIARNEDNRMTGF